MRIESSNQIGFRPVAPGAMGPNQPSRAAEPTHRSNADRWDGADGPISFATFLKKINEEHRVAASIAADHARNDREKAKPCDACIDDSSGMGAPSPAADRPGPPRVTRIIAVDWIPATGNLLDVLA